MPITRRYLMKLHLGEYSANYPWLISKFPQISNWDLNTKITNIKMKMIRLLIFSILPNSCTTLASGDLITSPRIMTTLPSRKWLLEVFIKMEHLMRKKLECHSYCGLISWFCSHTCHYI